MYYYNIFWIDSFLSILIAIYLVITGWKLLIQSLKVLMQFTPPEVNITQIANYINESSSIQNIHHIHAWQLTDHDIHFEANVEFKEDIPISRVCEILQTIEKDLQMQFGIDHVTLQPEFGRNCKQELISQEEIDNS